ncbi:hypothetical protein COOONC_19789 [Cooperia oncophora]
METLILMECALSLSAVYLANLPTHAFAVTNILYDMLMAKENMRHLAALDGNRVENKQFLELLKDTYLALGSTAALRSLPIKVQNDDKMRVLLSKARFEWLDVMSNPGASYQDLVDAHWYCGVHYRERCREPEIRR